jgi:hypothetical protein
VQIVISNLSERSNRSGRILICYCGTAYVDRRPALYRRLSIYVYDTPLLCVTAKTQAQSLLKTISSLPDSPELVHPNEIVGCSYPNKSILSGTQAQHICPSKSMSVLIGTICSSATRAISNSIRHTHCGNQPLSSSSSIGPAACVDTQFSNIC